MGQNFFMEMINISEYANEKHYQLIMFPKALLIKEKMK